MNEQKTPPQEKVPLIQHLSRQAIFRDRVSREQPTLTHLLAADSTFDEEAFTGLDFPIVEWTPAKNQDLTFANAGSFKNAGTQCNLKVNK